MNCFTIRGLKFLPSFFYFVKLSRVDARFWTKMEMFDFDYKPISSFFNLILCIQYLTGESFAIDKKKLNFRMGI